MIVVHLPVPIECPTPEAAIALLEEWRRQQQEAADQKYPKIVYAPKPKDGAA